MLAQLEARLNLRVPLYSAFDLCVVRTFPPPPKAPARLAEASCGREGGRSAVPGELKARTTSRTAGRAPGPRRKRARDMRSSRGAVPAGHDVGASSRLPRHALSVMFVRSAQPDRRLRYGK